MNFSVLFRTKHLAVLASASPLPDPENTMVNKRRPPAPRPQGSARLVRQTEIGTECWTRQDDCSRDPQGVLWRHRGQVGTFWMGKSGKASWRRWHLNRI